MPSIEIEQNESRAVVTLREPLTSALALNLRPRLQELIAKGATYVVMDLSSVDLVDSSGIGLLIATRNSLARVGGDMSIVGASSEIKQLFQLMRLDRHFEIGEKPGLGSPS